LLWGGGSPITPPPGPRPPPPPPPPPPLRREWAHPCHICTGTCANVCINPAAVGPSAVGSISPARPPSRPQRGLTGRPNHGARSETLGTEYSSSTADHSLSTLPRCTVRRRRVAAGPCACMRCITRGPHRRLDTTTAVGVGRPPSLAAGAGAAEGVPRGARAARGAVPEPVRRHSRAVHPRFAAAAAAAARQHRAGGACPAGPAAFPSRCNALQRAGPAPVARLQHIYGTRRPFPLRAALSAESVLHGC
jgi:hypothetical protein